MQKSHSRFSYYLPLALVGLMAQANAALLFNMTAPTSQSGGTTQPAINNGSASFGFGSSQDGTLQEIVTGANFVSLGLGSPLEDNNDGRLNGFAFTVTTTLAFATSGGSTFDVGVASRNLGFSNGFGAWEVELTQPTSSLSFQLVHSGNSITANPDSTRPFLAISSPSAPGNFDFDAGVFVTPNNPDAYNVLYSLGVSGGAVPTNPSSFETTTPGSYSAGDTTATFSSSPFNGVFTNGIHTQGQRAGITDFGDGNTTDDAITFVNGQITQTAGGLFAAGTRFRFTVDGAIQAPIEADNEAIVTVPEPSSAILASLGLASLAFRRRRQRLK